MYLFSTHPHSCVSFPRTLQRQLIDRLCGPCPVISRGSDPTLPPLFFIIVSHYFFSSILDMPGAYRTPLSCSPQKSRSFVRPFVAWWY
jgi:hypothetical protein